MPRHDLDVISLVAGTVFAGMAVVVLLDEGLGFPIRWALPVVLIAVGVAGLFATALHNRD